MMCPIFLYNAKEIFNFPRGILQPLGFCFLPLGRHAVNVVPILIGSVSRLGFAVIVAGGGGEIGIIVIINTDFSPILCCTDIINALQTTAILERMRADVLHAVRDRDARQTTATIERIITDACDAVSNGHTR